MTPDFKSYILDNIDYYKDLTSSIRKQRDDLLDKHDILMHDDILLEYQGLCFRVVVDDITGKFGLPYDFVIESIEDISLTKLLDESTKE